MNTTHGVKGKGLLWTIGQPQSSAFTLVELLVVLTVVASLTGIMVPAAQRARRKSRAVACQGQLRQWGVNLTIFLDEHDGHMLDATTDAWDLFYRPYCERSKGIFLCPMATHHNTNPNDPILRERQASGVGIGSKFTAWKLPLKTPATLEEGLLFGSYGINSWGLMWSDIRVNRSRRFGRSNVPVFLDCVFYRSQAQHTNEPPEYEGELANPGDIKSWCIDRHDGTVNSVFLDCSVRPVGLKELWTQNWSPWFDTENRWTRAGGVQPGDWPEWMRRFRDY